MRNIALAIFTFTAFAASPSSAGTQLGLGRVDQIAVSVSDLGRAEDFYENKIGLRKIFTSETVLLFDLGGLRLLVGEPEDPKELDFPLSPTTTIYLRCPDLELCVSELETRGVEFEPEFEFVSRQPTFDLWIAFFQDPDGNSLALMSESPRGFTHRRVSLDGN